MLPLGGRVTGGRPWSGLRTRGPGRLGAGQTPLTVRSVFPAWVYHLQCHYRLRLPHLLPQRHPGLGAGLMMAKAAGGWWGREKEGEGRRTGTHCQPRSSPAQHVRIAYIIRVVCGFVVRPSMGGLSVHQDTWEGEGGGTK